LHPNRIGEAVGDIFQPTHLLLILVVALLVLGPKWLPEVGRSLGKGVRDFRVGLSGHETVQQDPVDTVPVLEPPSAAAPGAMAAAPSRSDD
jgi:sec-independent protein translocase protein TatA